MTAKAKIGQIGAARFVGSIAATALVLSLANYTPLITILTISAT